MNIPDLAGYTLEEALNMAKNAGFEAFPIVTAPPRDKNSEPGRDYRVVRVKPYGDNKLELLVCRLTDR